MAKVRVDFRQSVKTSWCRKDIFLINIFQFKLINTIRWNDDCESDFLAASTPIGKYTFQMRLNRGRRIGEWCHFGIITHFYDVSAVLVVDSRSMLPLVLRRRFLFIKLVFLLRRRTATAIYSDRLMYVDVNCRNLIKFDFCSATVKLFNDLINFIWIAIICNFYLASSVKKLFCFNIFHSI